MLQSIKSNVLLDLIAFLGILFLLAMVYEAGGQPFFATDQLALLAITIGGLTLSVVVRSVLYVTNGHTYLMPYWYRYEHWVRTQQKRNRRRDTKR